MMEQFYRGLRVLVTGSTGFKGAWLSILLARWGAKVYGYALAKPPTKPSMFTLLDVASHVQQGQGDIRDRSTLAKYFENVRPDLVIHLAAQPLVGQGFRDPLTTFETNIMGTVNVLELANQSTSVRGVVIVTSDKCYRQRANRTIAFSEDDPLGGDDPYSASKAAQDLVADSYRRLMTWKGGAGVATCRAGNVIGGGDWAPDRLVPDIMRALQRNEDIILRNPLSVRPWQHVLEPLVGYLQLGQRLLEHPKTYSGPWNFGPAGERRTVQDMVDSIRSHWPRPVSTRASTMNHFDEIPHLEVDSGKAQKKLGWRPVWDFDTSVRTTADWYQTWMDGATSSQMFGLTVDQISRFTQDARRNQLAWAEVSL